MTTQWTHRGGAWTAPVGDGSIDVTLYDDELATLPPMVEALAEIERLRAEADSLRIEIEGCDCPAPWDLCPHGAPWALAVAHLSAENASHEVIPGWQWTQLQGDDAVYIGRALDPGTAYPEGSTAAGAARGPILRRIPLIHATTGDDT